MYQQTIAALLDEAKADVRVRDAMLEEFHLGEPIQFEHRGKTLSGVVQAVIGQSLSVRVKEKPYWVDVRAVRDVAEGFYPERGELLRSAAERARAAGVMP